MRGKTSICIFRFVISATSEIRFSFTVIYPVNIKRMTAIGTIQYACKRMRLSPSVRISLNPAPYPLDVIKGLLINNRLLRILENLPLGFINIMALFILKVLSCLEVYSVTKVLRLCKYACNG